MDDAVHALIMAFSVFVFLIALSVGMYMFSQVVTTAEVMTFYSDSTRYYDNIEFNVSDTYTDDNIKDGTARVVSAETIIPTLYRYYKENFCVKIYDAGNELIQIFDVNLEGKVHNSIGDTTAVEQNSFSQKSNYAYEKIYNDKTKKNYYLFGAPWLGSTESVKTRIDYFVNGKSGYINNTYVDYENNAFYQARMAGSLFKERFISYSYSGQTMQTDDGDTLVTGASEKDKIVIIYTLIN